MEEEDKAKEEKEKEGIAISVENIPSTGSDIHTKFLGEIRYLPYVEEEPSDEEVAVLSKYPCYRRPFSSESSAVDLYENREALSLYK